MLGHYGWIMTFDDIDHPDTGMTAGRVYVHKRNVEHGVSLAQGDIVSFYLYVDDQGLGAECCQLEQRPSPSLCADANEFVPSCAGPPPSWNVCAAEFVPTCTTGLSREVAEFVPKFTTVPSSLSMEAAEFVPSNFSMLNLDVPPLIPATMCSSMVLQSPTFNAINLAFFSDDESDDESSIASNDDISGNDGDKESNGGDEESNAGDEGISCDASLESSHQGKDFESSSNLDVVVKCTPLNAAQVSLAEDSTSAGSCSDSEEEPLVHCALRAPPGLSLPAGWRPPPGLSLAVLAA